MSNPFEALNISDDEEDQFVGTNNAQKTRKSKIQLISAHKERRQLKKLGTETSKPTTTEGVNSEVPVRVRDNARQVRHNRQGRPTKGVPEGHPLDRRSGTGREDRPRKQGGGRGNVGNVNDELNRDKYEKPTEQVTATTPIEEVPQEQQKPEEPQKPTLAEYYQSKGIDINATTTQRKVPVKGEVNAEWLKKEKLTLLETKEDKKRQENTRQNLAQQNNTRVEIGFGNSEILGFGTTKPAQRQREEEPQRTQNNGQKGGKRAPQAKVNLKEDDFPTL